jgi:hypothetical protein
LRKGNPVRAPIRAIAVAGGLVLGGAAAAVAAPVPGPTQTAPDEPFGDMNRMHAHMLSEHPDMGTMHERMMGGS